MLASPVLLPPSRQFWTLSARHIINRHHIACATGAEAFFSPLDFSALRVIVPAYEHAQWLMNAMSAELGSNFIPPRINTLAAWMALQLPEINAIKPVAESERLMTLYAQLREHGWLKKIFTARKNTDLLPLAQTLITLSDELTTALLPQVLASSENELNQQQRNEQVQQKWHQALAQLPMPAQQLISDEAQLVWQIWTSQLDGKDGISLRFAHMMRLADTAPDALLWISPVMPEGIEHEFLTAYAQKQAVQVISLDWRSSAIEGAFCAAWQEIMDHESHNGSNQELAEPPLLALRNQITTLEADSLEQEAQLGAQTIVEWLQQGKAAIALIAQDRVVARRIRALLERAHVHVADETGWKLSTTRAAAGLAAWFDVVASRADTVMLLDLFKSPYFAPLSMADVDEKTNWITVIESALLRANVVSGWESIHYALESKPECAALITQLKRLSGLHNERRKLSGWLDLTQLTLHEFGMIEQWQTDTAGQKVLQLITQLNDDCAMMMETFSFSEWRVFINLQLESTTFQGDKQDKRVVMLPLNGARLRRFDAVLMAGCDASHLPSQPKEVLFFTNAVRRECCLITREQRQRQQLRDFAELLSANSVVVLSWQRQQRGEANPVSPWIERLNLVLGKAGLPTLSTQTVQLSTLSLATISTVQPRPVAASLQPSSLSASGYNSFIACPYQFFATRMLGLSAPDTLSDRPEKRDYGGWLHAILHHYHATLKTQPANYPKSAQEALLREISDDYFSTIVQKNPAALGFSVRWEKSITAYIEWSQGYADLGWQYEEGELWLEKNLQWDDGQITLRGQIDRIDKNQQGEVAVLDYKTNGIGALRAKLKLAEDQQLPFYGLLAQNEQVRITSAHYVALEMTKEKIADVSADNYLTRQQALQHSIVHSISAIGQGAELPAQGVSTVCQYCDVRGLCRKGAW